MLQALSRAGQADVILLTVWFALNLVLLCLHEPWRDEAEAFMIAREYGLGEIWRQLSSEGQPLLWFLILLVPAKLGVPFRLAGLISLFVCAAAAARFLRVSPLPKPLTWIILFSPLFTYYNPVISRSYCIALLLCVHLIGIRRSRRPRPVALGVAAALLFQTHLMLSGVALGCTLELLAGCIAGRAKRRLPPDSPGDLPGLMRRPADRQYLAGFLIALSGLILLILEMLPTFHVLIESVQYRQLYSFREQGMLVFRTLYQFRDARVSPFIVFLVFLLPAMLTVPQVFALPVAMRSDRGEAAGRKRFRGIRPAGWLLTTWLGIAVYFYIAIYIRVANHMQLSLCLMMILLVAVCTAPRFRYPGYIFVFLCVLGMPRLFISAFADLSGAYSQSSAMAEYIREEIPEDAVITVKSDYYYTPVAARFRSLRRAFRKAEAFGGAAIPEGEKEDISGITEIPSGGKTPVFLDLGTGGRYVNYVWDHNYPEPDLEAAKKKSAGRPVYYLTAYAYDLLASEEEMELVFAADGDTVTDERYYLYLVKQ